MNSEIQQVCRDLRTGLVTALQLAAQSAAKRSEIQIRLEWITADLIAIIERLEASQTDEAQAALWPFDGPIHIVFDGAQPPVWTRQVDGYWHLVIEPMQGGQR